MKVVIVCDLVSTFLRFRRFLALAMVQRGHQVTVVASVNDVETTDFFDHDAITLAIVPMNRTGINPFSDLSYCQRLKKVIGEIRPDRILAYQPKAIVWTAVAARSLNIKNVSLLFAGLGYLFSPDLSRKDRVVQWISRRLYRFAFREVDTTFFQNPDDQETFRRLRLLSPQTKTVVVNGSGVSLEEFPYSDPPTEPMRFVMATRLLADKGVREFADVAGELVEAYGDRVRFEIAGGLDTNPTAVNQGEIDRWKSNGWVSYRGQVSDMVTFLKEASVFVLPSYYMEGTPRSILEAMSSGRAIITTDNRGCRETVEQGVNGFLVKRQDRSSLKMAMESCVNDPELVAAMGRASRRIAEEKYDVNAVCDQMLVAMQL